MRRLSGKTGRQPRNPALRDDKLNEVNRVPICSFSGGAQIRVIVII